MRIALVLVMVAACGGDITVSDRPLAGKVGGQTWTYVAGDSDPFLSDDSELFVALFGEAFTTCDFGSPDSPSLLTAIPREPGEYELGFGANGHTVTFYSAGDNLIATEGLMVVEAVTDTVMSAGINAKFDGANAVDGTFDVTICP